MLKIEIKNRFTGKIIFEYSKDNNTILATLLEAIKSRANLYGANLYGANLYGANLTRANLDGANLTRANLYGANLDGANLDVDSLKDKHLLQTIPQGELIGWKKVHGVIVKLKIPHEAKRLHGIGSRKCRAEFAEVLDVENETKEILNTAYSHHVLYKTGEKVTPDSFLDCIKTECGNGINFFISREEAVNY